MKNTSDFHDIIQKLNTLKAMELQIEYLKSTDNIAPFYKKYTNHIAFKSISELYKCICETIEMVSGFIPKAIKDFFAEHEYDIFTADNYGRSFWNEIPLPRLTKYYFEQLQNIVGANVDTSGTYYALDIYDMSDESLVFINQEHADKFFTDINCAPCTLYKIEPQDGRAISTASEVSNY